MPSSSLHTTIAGRVLDVRERIEAACARAGRDASEVTLVAVSKGFDVASIAEVVAAGVADLGENRAQELLPKVEAASKAGLAPRWHFIGHLQRNKVREVVPVIHALHSVDAIRLIEAIAALRRVGRGASDADHPLPCYIEVNVAGEAQKEGAAPSEVGALLAGAAGAPGIEVLGLMTVAPLVDDPEQARPAFRTLRELAAAHGLRGLSMGMTNDFEVAIEEGATLVRVGRAIFGERLSR
ncbi:MAG: YggS family pyridoxal phosphate-dependent enzyme [Dehalococcoidia bacterium]|nr:YggS family pyridoxal phosphate-dependent enzyme [Dehalococcoidia bacterium]